jgi:hypothetical protein
MAPAIALSATGTRGTLILKGRIEDRVFDDHLLPHVDPLAEGLLPKLAAARAAWRAVFR